jgi:hypothetical protein
MVKKEGIVHISNAMCARRTREFTSEDVAGSELDLRLCSATNPIQQCDRAVRVARTGRACSDVDYGVSYSIRQQREWCEWRKR